MAHGPSVESHPWFPPWAHKAPLAYSASLTQYVIRMRRSPPKSTIEDVPRPVLPAPNAHKSPAPAVVVACWCGLIERIDKHLDAFTRDIWRRFDSRDLEPLKWAILRRRRVLALQLWPYSRVPLGWRL
jgi:hypothetical protein